MAAVSSASFTADFAMRMQGDTTKITDPTAKALLSEESPSAPRARARTSRRPQT